MVGIQRSNSNDGAWNKKVFFFFGGIVICYYKKSCTNLRWFFLERDWRGEE